MWSLIMTIGNLKLDLGFFPPVFSFRLALLGALSFLGQHTEGFLKKTIGNFSLIGHISLIPTLNCNIFEALDSRLPKLHNHIWFALRTSLQVAKILS